MKISEVSRLTGVPPTTVKYYLREGLVHAGERVERNQTAYDDTHVQRVRLVRALIETGGLSIAAAKEVLATLDADDSSLADTFDVACRAISVGGAAAGASDAGARERIATLAAAHGWRTTPENPGFAVAAQVLDAFAATGYEPSRGFLDAYASAASVIARADLEALTTRTRPDLVAELMVVGTVLGDALIAGLRRLAQEHETTQFFPVPTGLDDQEEAK
ncbi:MerR family transcriptional regulator [Agromyces sp. NPDC049794]|uniref:MerR family transcriptional regulator n=1 Tax=unclassified Agromyces TaxID=2639701 RepID=UPI0033DC2FF8